MTAVTVDPDEVDMAIVPIGTPAPAWVVSTETLATDPGEECWVWAAPVPGRASYWCVEQFCRVDDGAVVLSQPYITTDIVEFQLTVEEARASASTLYTAAKLLLDATEQTWELLGSAGQV
jgi:hypothetical protein